MKYILILLLSVNLFAANWYVDKNATGLNNGTSWIDAWTSFSAINWASISAGDFIYISGGSSSKTYNEQLAPEKLGTATNRITIIAGKYSPSPSGHSGTPIITGGILFDEYSGSTNPDYVTVKGFEITGQIDFSADANTWLKGIIIDSCYVHDWGNDAKGFNVLAYVDSLIIQNCIIIDCLDADCTGETDGIHIANGSLREPNMIIIRNNYIRSMSQDPLAHNDAIQSASGDGIIIYNNIVINDSVNSPEGGGIPGIISNNDIGNDDYPPSLIFNNLFFMNGYWYPNSNQGWVYSVRHDQNGDTWAEIGPTYIVGNTFVANGPRLRGLGNDGGYAHLIVNNIMTSYCLPDAGGANNWRTGSTHGWMPVLSFGDVYGHTHVTDSIRSNLFWRQDSTNGASGDGQDPIITGTFTTGTLDYSSDFSDWIAIGGTGIFRDPLMTTAFGHLSDQGDVSPDIASNSPAIDAGEDLTYLVAHLKATYPTFPEDIIDAILVDYYGNERGADGDWDIGAVEYQGSTPPPVTKPRRIFMGFNGNILQDNNKIMAEK